MADQTDPIAEILRSAQTSDRVRAAAWDAYQQAVSPDDLATRLRDLQLPDDVKASLWDAKAGQATPPPPESPATEPTGRGPLADVGVGALKGAAHTAIDLGQLVHQIPGVSSGIDALFGTPGLSQNAFEQARQDTEYKNTAQRAGGVAETVAELALPGAKAAAAIPSTAKAGRMFQNVMAAAKDVPVDVNAPGQVALRIQQLAERGGSMPMAVRKFLNRITNPDLGAPTYEEMRDFASNISRLSVNEYGRLTPVVGREVANLRVALNKAVGQAAQQVGKLDEYEAAMREYARASKFRDMLQSAWEGAKKASPYAGAAGLGYWMTEKLKGLLSTPE